MVSMQHGGGSRQMCRSFLHRVPMLDYGDVAVFSITVSWLVATACEDITMCMAADLAIMQGHALVTCMCVMNPRLGKDRTTLAFQQPGALSRAYPTVPLCKRHRRGRSLHGSPWHVLAWPCLVWTGMPRPAALCRPAPGDPVSAATSQACGRGPAGHVAARA